MGSIPLPALHIQPPAAPQDPLEQYGRILQLRNEAQRAPLQLQAAQQQVQLGQGQLQEQQQQIKDQQATTAAMQSWDGKSLDDLAPLVLKNGGSSTAVMGLRKQAQALKEQASTIAKNDADTGSKVLDTHIKQNQMVSGALSSVLQAPDDQLPQVLTSTAQSLIQQGLLDPQHAQAAAQLAQLGDPKQIRQSLDLMRKGLMSSQEILDQAKQTELERHDQAMEKKPSEAMQGMNDFLQSKAAVKGSPLTAQEGLAARQEYFKRNKSQTNVAVAGQTGPDDIKDTAQMILQGQAPPVLTEYSFRDRTKLAGELHRQGYNLAQAEQDWKATQKYLGTLNGSQQTRLRQAISFTSDTIPQIQQAFNEWKATGLPTGFQSLNAAALKAAENLPGKSGSAAHNLNALISDFTSELGTVYKGGNSSTDESLKLAAQNLGANWNEQTFNDSLKRIEQSLKIRKNSIQAGSPAGVSAESPYPAQGAPQSAPSASPGPGNVVRYKIVNGQLVAQ